jgi:hypothetical protein
MDEGWSQDASLHVDGHWASVAPDQQQRSAAIAHVFEAGRAWKNQRPCAWEETMKGLAAFVLFTQLVAIAAVLAAAKLRAALGAPGVTARQFVVIALQLWLPTALMFVLVMNVALEKWELRPLLAIPVLLLALLIPGVAVASLLLRRASRRTRTAVALGA